MSVRQSIIFWILLPILVTALLLAFVEVSGRFFGGELSNSAVGIMFLTAFVPIVAAHLAFLSAITGLVLFPFGLRADNKLMISILLGLAFGVFMLHKMYLT